MFNIQTKTGEVAITNDNFFNYFFDARISKPQEGQVLAKFTAIAEFGEGEEKKHIIQLLKLGKVQDALHTLKTVHAVREEDCYKLLIAMNHDMLVMTEEEVEKKLYEFVLELFFYTKKEYVPDSPHWETVNLTYISHEKFSTISE